MTWFRKLFGGNPVSVSATADHVELGLDHLILGLNLACNNSTADSIFIDEIQLMVYVNGPKKAATIFEPLEYFARLPGQRSFQKRPFASLMLRVGESPSEHIRFVSQEMTDISPDTYLLEFKMTANDQTVYTAETKLKVQASIKYRQADEWTTD